MNNYLWQHKDKETNTLGITDIYDREFINLVLEIENQSQKLNKQKKLKIESWIKLLCIPTSCSEFKKNRNLHAISLLDCIINDNYESPYNKSVHETENLPQLDRAIIKSKLSEKLKKIQSLSTEENFQKYTEYYYSKYINPKNELKIKKQEYKNCVEKLNPVGNKKRKLNNKKFENLVRNNPKFNFESYKYERDIEKLKLLLEKLDLKLKNKDLEIVANNEKKRNLEHRIKELESAIQKIIINKDHDRGVIKSIEMILLKN